MTAQQFIKRIFDEVTILPHPCKRRYKDKVSTHLIVGIDHIQSPDTDEVALFGPIVKLFEAARKVYGRPIFVTSGYRTHKYQQKLTKLGYKTAKFVSPHSLACALDLDARPLYRGKKRVKTEKQVNQDIRSAVRQAAKKLGFDEPRIGFRSYGERFNHVDLKFMLFKPYTDLPHPSDWKDLPRDVRSFYRRVIRPGRTW